MRVRLVQVLAMVALGAPAPRSNGKPDFSGIWLTGNPIPCSKASGEDFLECGAELPLSRDAINVDEICLENEKSSKHMK